MTNADIAKVLYEIAMLLDMDGVPFKPRAYERVAQSVEGMGESLAEIFRRGGPKAIASVDGVGKSIADKIVTLLEAGRLPYRDELYAKTPVDLAMLSRIEGLGPKNIRLLYQELGVRTVADLEAAARAGKVRKIARFGEKSEQKILRGIEFLAQRTGRFPLGTVLPLLNEIAARLEKLRGVRRVAVAGSVRRRRETAGDGDILVVAAKAEAIMDFFTTMPEVKHVQGKGPTKSSVKLQSGMDVDLRVVPAESWGAALLYFTGSKSHNVALRRLALERELKLNEYGLYRGERAIAGKTEQEVYKALDLAWIPPEMREDTGEIDAAARGELPQLVDVSDLRGDLQIQTDWTDGKASLEAMALEAKRLGREYIAITDHTQGLAMMGMDAGRLRQQMEAIDALNRKLRGIRVLKGAEVNIGRDGSLDIDDATLAELDVVGVAVHSYFDLPRSEQTRRVIRAMENPHAHIFFHPTARILMRREACDLDMDAVLAAAKRTGTILEVDAHPGRLDLKDDHVRKAIGAGVKLAIDTDAHALPHLDYLHFGVATARRGWATKDDVVNTRPLKEFLELLK